MSAPGSPFVRPDGYVPWTERLLGTDPGPRLVGIAIFALLPYVHLVAYDALATAAGILLVTPESLTHDIGVRLLNTYITLLTLWAAADIARRLARVRALTPDDRGEPADWRTWLLPPLLMALAFSVFNELGHLMTFGADTMLRNPLPFVASFVLALGIRIPQATAFWTLVVALLGVARMGRGPLPAAFPEDRSLGLRPVGEMLTAILVLYAAVFVPTFVFGTQNPTDLVSVLAVFVAGLAALLVAVWRLHQRLAAERASAVATARDRYARAYRDAAKAKAGDDVAAAGARLSLAASLLQGAESIYEWPLDERMQRIGALVLTGVLTGIVVRLILLAFGI